MKNVTFELDAKGGYADRGYYILNFVNLYNMEFDFIVEPNALELIDAGVRVKCLDTDGDWVEREGDELVSSWNGDIHRMPYEEFLALLLLNT